MFYWEVEKCTQVKMRERGREIINGLLEVTAQLKVNERGGKRRKRVVEFFSEFKMGEMSTVVDRRRKRMVESPPDH
jgi:hypothetical protein